MSEFTWQDGWLRDVALDWLGEEIDEMSVCPIFFFHSIYRVGFDFHQNLVSLASNERTSGGIFSLDVFVM